MLLGEYRDLLDGNDEAKKATKKKIANHTLMELFPVN